MDAAQRPFPHAVIERFAAPELLAACEATWPAADWPHWHRYDGRNAVKRATRDPHRVTAAAWELLRRVAGLPVGRLLRLQQPSWPDFDLHGAGMHEIPRGGRLAWHLDAEVHPARPWRRAASAVLFVNSVWGRDWGGDLQLRGDDQSQKTIGVRPGRLVLFAAGPGRWHGVPQSLDCPHAETRKTLALFWWRRARAGEPAGANRATFVD